MVSKQYPRVGETVFHEILENGLHVYVDRRRDFQKSYAFFATNYGGMDMRFRLDGEWKNTPAGVAHFLEHKMFDTQDGNALQDLAANGASPNAFTSSAITGYFFESTEKFFDNLKILLSFVSIPYFTQESVDKEQGIIGQEIRMVEDDPDNQVFYALMECLYDHHPIRVPIAGTQASIAKITAGTLYSCHKAFYTPSNMVLTVAGDVDPAQVCAVAREILPVEPGLPIDRDYGGEEDLQAACSEKELTMEVSTPIFQLGFKADPAKRGEEWLRRTLAGELACEVLLGSSSPLYAKLYSEGLINKNFGYGFELYPGCALMVAGGESKDPRKVRDAVLAEGERLAREGVDPALFGRVKKGVYGAKVRSLNSFENVCIELAQAHFAGVEYFRFPEMFDSISLSDVEACIRSWVTPQRCGLAVVRPGEAK
ncbi:EF-P 5-aminopentanol modification-associated protein YfmH [Intestinimonas massiliensis (ex Afouda et al. 2020)]|uniref:EF-P 5-aminopentanol modification-associated protein YfmH n=1 Tax=Intestinimonas massiliensis (ex Afouda et al. 2020) TaxID=1673721 RepID=UPI00102F8019|nr:pitrilysin family protein [Intestinimonas massiliensis (ex Afouda et al. 2020)]